MNEGPIQKVADAAKEIAKAAEKLTGFMITVVGAPLEQVSGALDDRIRLFRYKNLLKIQDQVEAIPLAEKGTLPFLSTSRFSISDCFAVPRFSAPAYRVAADPCGIAMPYIVGIL